MLLMLSALSASLASSSTCFPDVGFQRCDGRGWLPSVGQLPAAAAQNGLGECTDRGTDRQKHIQKGRQIDRQSVSQTDGQIDRQRNRQADSQIERQTGRQRQQARQTEQQTCSKYRHINRWIVRNRQTEKQINRLLDLEMNLGKQVIAKA